jgi:hypothetical protein
MLLAPRVGQLVEPLLVAGIDPGLASGGLVVIDVNDRERVVAAISLVETAAERAYARTQADEALAAWGGWSDREFVTATFRAQRWLGQFQQALATITEHQPVTYFAVESFVDQRSRAREEQQRLIKNRWHTPLVIGLLMSELERYGATAGNERVVYQNAGVVIRQLADEIARLKNRKGVRDILVPGDQMIRNDHQRKAFAHALALSLRLRARQS